MPATDLMGPRSAGSRFGALETLSVALALAGIGVAGYLTYTHYAGIDPACVAGSSGCHVVQASEYAELAGVPVALIGLVGYVLILASVFVSPPLGPALTLGLTLGGTGFSAYLTYLEIWDIEAICQWCVASAVIMTTLFGVSAVRFVREE